MTQETQPPKDRPLDTSLDVVVIGAGVIGCAVALELARRGLRTLNIDALPAAGYGSTSSSSAIVRFNYSTDAGVALAYEGVHYWRDWPNHMRGGQPIPDDRIEPLAEFVQVPMLALRTEANDQQALLERLRRYGIAHEDLTLAEAEARYPLLDFRRFGPPVPLDAHDAAFWGEPAELHAGAIAMNEAGYITDPQLAAQNLAQAARREGAQFRFNTKVTSILHGDGAVRGVATDDGTEFFAPVVVNVAGPHSSVINRMAGVADSMTMDTRALRREVFVVPAAPGTDYEADGAMVGDLDTGVYFRPERGNNILIGSAEPECDELEWIDDPDHYRESLTDDEYQLLVLRTSRRVKGLLIPQTKRGLASLYDVTEDWTPIYDRSALEGFYMAVGTSGNQFKNAAVAGHVMAELITAVQAGHDHDSEPLSVVGKYTGFEIDLGTFSRNRVLTADSARSVLG